MVLGAEPAQGERAGPRVVVQDRRRWLDVDRRMAGSVGRSRRQRILVAVVFGGEGVAIVEEQILLQRDGLRELRCDLGIGASASAICLAASAFTLA